MIMRLRIDGVYERKNRPSRSEMIRLKEGDH